MAPEAVGFNHVPKMNPEDNPVQLSKLDTAASS
jgi:hypothetical protein